MRNLIVLAIVGFVAQVVDGSLGMAYGVTSTTLLLAVGIAPAAASAAVHFAELGTTLVSGASHFTLGNVDWRVVATMAVPGGIAAFIGATFLSSIDGDAAKPWIALLLLSLGGYVLWRFLRNNGERPRLKGRPKAVLLVPLAVVAGLMDAIGGGGWGPVGTPTLLASGKLEPRKVIGSIDTSEFVVAVGGSLGFLMALGTQGIDFRIALALLIGGVFAAPIAASLARYLPAQVLAVAAGGLIVVTNSRTLLNALGAADSVRVIVLVALVIAWAGLIILAVRQNRQPRSVDSTDAAVS